MPQKVKSTRQKRGAHITATAPYVGMLERLFEAAGCKFVTVKAVHPRTNPHKSPRTAPPKTVTHSHYEQAKPRRKK